MGAQNFGKQKQYNMSRPQPDFCSGILHVFVGEGSKMRNPEGVSKIDPYLYIKYGENVSIGNVHRKAGGKCQFDWRVQLPHNTRGTAPIKMSCPTTKHSSSSSVSSNGSNGSSGVEGALEITVFDQNTARPDTKVAKLSIHPSDISTAKGKSQAFRNKLPLHYHRGGGLGLGLLKPTEHVGGYLEVEMWWEEKPAPFPLPCLRLVKNNNHCGGLLRGIVDGGVYDILRTWQIHLWGAHSIFQGTTCGWNKNYDAAKQIYGPTPDCSAIREAIRVQHKLLYSHEHTFASASIKHVTGSQELLKAVPDHDLNTKQDKSIRFTYVICTDCVMNFSVTSSMTGRDFLSKHALHSNASQNVIYSGEFFVDRLSPKAIAAGSVRLIIDNNSGTFAPSKEKLPMLEELLEFNFGTEIPIIVLDQGDPRLKELSNINNVQ